MNGNIKARDILQMLLDYPEREYPIVEVLDPKKKKQAKKEAKAQRRTTAFDGNAARDVLHNVYGTEVSHLNWTLL